MNDNLESRHWLEMLEIGEPGINVLRIVVGESIAREETRGSILVAPGIKVEGSALMTVDAGSQIFEILWTDYVAYTVTNESFAFPEKGDVVSDDVAKQLRLQSRFFFEMQSSEALKFFRSSTFAEEVLRKPVRHWRIGCQNHIIDIISVSVPAVRLIQDYKLPTFNSADLKH